MAASAVAPMGTAPEVAVLPVPPVPLTVSVPLVAVVVGDEDLLLMTRLGLVVSELLRALRIWPASSTDWLWLTVVALLDDTVWSRGGATLGIGDGSLGLGAAESGGVGEQSSSTWLSEARTGHWSLPIPESWGTSLIRDSPDC